ncbi:MAG: NAD(P)-dependent glycerol-1-phosphate dehydrogenase [Euryarchaeota archaeon]|nr:NAD(P)-dependent glycerol-1-phosphate dehydrogenase [Euryarchaeota archaeon]
MSLPRIVVMEHDALLEVGNVLRELKLGGAGLIVCGPLTCRYGRQIKHMLDEEYSTEVLVVADATIQEVERVAARASERASGDGFILAVGGGKTIDIAKIASVTARLPFISVPTAASHDGIASMRASIRFEEGTQSIEAQTPLAIIADTGIIAQAPHRLLAAGCGDLISNYTAVKDWELAKKLRGEEFSEYAAALSLMSTEIILDSSSQIKPNLEESVRLVVKALVSSSVAMSIAGSSRPASGSEHKFSHALDVLAPSPALHGEQCGVGTIMMTYLHGGDWQKIRRALQNIGAPVNARELGIDDRYIIEALLYAKNIRPERYTILGEGLTRKAAEELARVTLVVG